MHKHRKTLLSSSAMKKAQKFTLNREAHKIIEELISEAWRCAQMIKERKNNG